MGSKITNSTKVLFAYEILPAVPCYWSYSLPRYISFKETALCSLGKSIYTYSFSSFEKFGD